MVCISRYTLIIQSKVFRGVYFKVHINYPIKSISWCVIQGTHYLSNQKYFVVCISRYTLFIQSKIFRGVYFKVHIIYPIKSISWCVFQGTHYLSNKIYFIKFFKENLHLFKFNPFGVESNLSRPNILNAWGRDTTLIHIILKFWIIWIYTLNVPLVQCTPALKLKKKVITSRL